MRRSTHTNMVLLLQPPAQVCLDARKWVEHIQADIYELVGGGLVLFLDKTQETSSVLPGSELSRAGASFARVYRMVGGGMPR